MKIVSCLAFAFAGLVKNITLDSKDREAKQDPDLACARIAARAAGRAAVVRVDESLSGLIGDKSGNQDKFRGNPQQSW